jgi:hypothetical protein
MALPDDSAPTLTPGNPLTRSLNAEIIAVGT